MSTNTREGREPAVEVDHSPALLSGVVAAASALVGTLLTAPFFGLSLVMGGMGLLLFVAGLFVSERRAHVSLGAAFIFLGAVISGAFGASVGLVLPGLAATMIAWDVGQNAISIGDQLGRQAPTRRAEVVHIAATVVVTVLVSGLALGIFLVAGGGKPASAVVLLTFGAVLLVWALRT